MKSDGIDKYHQILLKIYFTMKSDDIYSIFIFFHITMSMAEAWLGGIGKYPPHPEGLGNTLLLPRLKPREVRGYCLTLQDSEGIFQYLLAMLQPLSHFRISLTFSYLVKECQERSSI